MANGPYWDEGLMLGSGEFPEIVCIGDSWFWYPLNNLLIPIYGLWAGNKIVFAQGKVGAEAEELAKGKYLVNFRRILKGYPGIRAVLISAGGNDFAGDDDLSKVLQPKNVCENATTGAECFDAGADPNLANEDGVTPLQIAMDSGNPELIAAVSRKK